MGQDYLNYKLSRSDSWVIQKGTFKNRHTFDETTNQLYPFPILNGITGLPPFPGIYFIIDVNYKGISEFEKDAIRNSTRRMVVNIDFYDFYKIPDIKNSENKSIIIYGPVMFKKHIENQVRLLASNKIETKEVTGLDSYILNHECFYNANFWWDTVNDFYIFFDETKMDLIENAQNNMKLDSLGHIEEEDIEVLSNYYLSVNLDLDQESREFLRAKKKLNSFFMR